MNDNVRKWQTYYKERYHVIQEVLYACVIEKGDRDWDGWMASPTWWTWVWASSGSWWWTGKADVLQSLGSQRAGLSDWTDGEVNNFGAGWRGSWSGLFTDRRHSCVCVCSVTLAYLTLCDPMDCSLPGSSARGIFQARILQWAATSYCRGSSQPRDQTCNSWVSCINRWILPLPQEAP